ncbi:MAG: thiamine-phosphate kinase [Candidatus Omnitrophica bacterium]|nr:thiamine-phosphate kinase [Candidatus Omnitrophota bacterium]
MGKNRKLKTIESLGEFGLIDQIKKWVPSSSKQVVKGIGDDTAVFAISRGRYQLMTIDTIVEDVDFVRKRATPEQIGWKALAINLSDIAAMGGTPMVALVSLTLSKNTSVDFVKRFYAGIRRLAQKFHVSIVGGDLSRGDRISCSVALLGESKKGATIFRSGARVGDLLCVTGTLGGSILGKHLTFMPRIKEGKWIARFGASAMIDISDGLGQDIHHLMERKGIGFVIDEGKVPVSRAALMLTRGDKKKALIRAFCDGEDFELLFTISPVRFRALKNTWPRKFKTLLTVIGQVVSVSKSLVKPPKYLGYQHF